MENHSKNAVGCAECAFRADCGGIDEKESFWGCYSECFLNCNPETCDLTCPNNPRLFVKRLEEIEGAFGFSPLALNVPSIQLPQYMPKIHNGSSRQAALNVSVVAIPVRELLRKSGTKISCRFENSWQVRRHFLLSNQTRYIISCISVDEDVEMIWAGLRYGQLATEFARLKPAAIIVPNFSFFIDDVPRIHTLYNRKRICLAARILSEAGCRVIIPLNALTSDDWNFWYELLRGNPTMRYVAKEFQTGLFGPRAATRAIEHLADLQERLGRSLHPVVFAGSRHNNILHTHFNKHTIIESRAFLMATKRRRAIQERSGRYSEVFSPTAVGEAFDELLRWNINTRSKRLKK
jgi:hypothetical protein